MLARTFALICLGMLAACGQERAPAPATTPAPSGTASELRPAPRESSAAAPRTTLVELFSPADGAPLFRVVQKR